MTNQTGAKIRRKISEDPAFCTEVEELGDSEEAETLISGCLIRVKGWWRKGARFEQRRATVRRSVSSENERRKISLRGVAVESFALEGLFGFRILPLPSSSSSPIDLATETGDQRDLWMAAISIASAHKPQGHVAGVLRVTLVEGGITQDQSMSKRLTLAPNAFFCVVSCNGMCSRTVAKRPQKTVDGPGPGTSLGIIDLGEIFEFPITNDARELQLAACCRSLLSQPASAEDDPDSLIQLQVWSTDFRRGSMRGRVDVPLYALGRKHQREMQLSLRDVDRPKGENSEVGFLRAWCSFEQDLGSLLLPRPHKPPKAAWQTVGIDKGMREQLKELETFMQQFEVFSSRFMHHSDVSRSLSLKYKRIEQPQSSRLISGLKAQKNTSEGDDADVKERYENERRLVLGRFTSSRLRLWDPPPWTGALVWRVADGADCVALRPVAGPPRRCPRRVAAHHWLRSAMAQLDVAIFIVSAVIMAMKPLLLHLTGDAVREDVALPPAFFQLAVEALKALICVLVLLLRRQTLGEQGVLVSAYACAYAGNIRWQHMAEMCGLSAVVWNGWWHTASFALPAAVYLLMNVLTVIAARLLQPPMLQLIASIKILGEERLSVSRPRKESNVILITAIASRIVMSKKLEPLQWLALVLLTVGVAVGGRGKSTMESGEVSEVPLLGVALMLFNCTLSSLGGVLTERALKQRSSGELTIFATNLHMALHSLSMNASALSLVTSAELPRLELLQMSDFVALSNEALNGILISLLMKRIDAIAKNYVFSVSVFTTAAMSAVVLRLWPPWQFYLGSSICAASMALYAQGGRPKKIQ
eukprot:g1979.t1